MDLQIEKRSCGENLYDEEHLDGEAMDFGRMETGQSLLAFEEKGQIMSLK